MSEPQEGNSLPVNPIPEVDQSFIPESWISERISTDGPFKHIAVYKDTTTGKVHKKPLSPSAYQQILKYPYFADYKQMISQVTSMEFKPKNDYEAYIAGQVLSANIYKDINKNETTLLDTRVEAAANAHDSAFYKSEMDKAKQQLSELQERYSHPESIPEFIQRMEQLQQQNAALQEQNRNLSAENAYMRGELDRANQYKEAVERGDVGNLYEVVNNMLNQKDTEYTDRINNLTVHNTAAAIQYEQRISALNTQIQNLQLEVQRLQEENRRNMDIAMYNMNIQQFDNTNDIDNIKRMVVQFIDRVLGVYDTTADGITSLQQKNDIASRAVADLTHGVVNINGVFNDIPVPNLNMAYQDANNMKNALQPNNPVMGMRLGDLPRPPPQNNPNVLRLGDIH